MNHSRHSCSHLLIFPGVLLSFAESLFDYLNGLPISVNTPFDCQPGFPVFLQTKFFSPTFPPVPPKNHAASFPIRDCVVPSLLYNRPRHHPILVLPRSISQTIHPYAPVSIIPGCQVSGCEHRVTLVTSLSADFA